MRKFLHPLSAHVSKQCRLLHLRVRHALCLVLLFGDVFGSPRAVEGVGAKNLSFQRALIRSGAWSGLRMADPRLPLRAE